MTKNNGKPPFRLLLRAKLTLYARIPAKTNQTRAYARFGRHHEDRHGRRHGESKKKKSHGYLFDQRASSLACGRGRSRCPATRPQPSSPGTASPRAAIMELSRNPPFQEKPVAIGFATGELTGIPSSGFPPGDTISVGLAAVELIGIRSGGFTPGDTTSAVIGTPIAGDIPLGASGAIPGSIGACTPST